MNCCKYFLKNSGRTRIIETKTFNELPEICIKCTEKKDAERMRNEFFKKEQKDELDCITETLLRQEWVKLVNRISADPLLDDWILDLAVHRCKEIRKILSTVK